MKTLKKPLSWLKSKGFHCQKFQIQNKLYAQGQIKYTYCWWITWWISGGKMVDNFFRYFEILAPQQHFYENSPWDNASDRDI